MSKEIKRIFIVGIARAGTTLVQSVLGAHPDILTFPESHFLDYNFPHEFWKKPFSFTGEKNREITAEVMENMGIPEEFGPERLEVSSDIRLAKSFFEILDKWATKENKKAWLEKTPIHVRYLDKVEKAAPGALVIHVIRKPVDNIASLIRVSRRHPEYFNHGSLRAAQTRYRRDVKRSLKHAGKPGHIFICYADFCTHTKKIQEKCWQFIGLNTDFESRDYREMSEQVSGDEESWKAMNQNKITLQTGNFEGLTDKEIKQLKSGQEKLNALYHKFDPYFLKYDE